MKFILAHQQARQRAIDAVRNALDGHIVLIKEPTRSLEQNARLWSMLHDISIQVDWYGQKLTEEEWKDVFSAALKKQRAVPGIDGGFVILGARTSKMNKREFSDLMELISAFGMERDVKFSDRWKE